jgi:hypothetical protein
MLTKIHPTFDWSIGPDGRFLLGKIASGGQRSLKVILNWTPTLDQISRPTK